MVTANLKKALLLIGTLAILAVLPLFYGADNYLMKILIICFIWSVFAASWDLILGYANVFSFGHLSFFIIGAYTSGLLSKLLGLSPWLGMLAGGVVAATVGGLIGIPCLRLQGMYLAIVTFSLNLILPTLITWANLGRFPLFDTGGTFGLDTIPAPTLFGYTFNKTELIPWYYLSFAVCMLFLATIYRIIHSPIGLAFVALRDAEPLAKTLGINDYKYKILVFCLTAFIAGVMGAYYAHFFGIISPATLSLEVFLIVLVMVLFGGLGVFPGAAIGAFVITIVNEILRPALHWRLVILGTIIILTMIFMPKGLMGIPELTGRLSHRVSKWKAGRSKALETEEVR